MQASKLVVVVLALGCPAVAHADDIRLSADFDLVPWASKGHSFWLGAAPEPHWKLMLGSVSGDLPSFTQPTGWTTRSLSGSAMMAQYAFEPDGAGWFVGAVAIWMQWRHARTDMPAIEGERDQLIVAGLAGYTWFPAHNGLYVQPLLGVGKGVFSHGSVTLEGETYQDKLPVAVLPALFVGWQFGRRS